MAEARLAGRLRRAERLAAQRGRALSFAIDLLSELPVGRLRAYRPGVDATLAAIHAACPAEIDPSRRAAGPGADPPGGWQLTRHHHECNRCTAAWLCAMPLCTWQPRAVCAACLKRGKHE